MSEKTEAIPEGVFDFDGYQVVRGEFFAHTFEPSLTLSNSKLYVNMACLNKMPTAEYVQLLINQTSKKLVVRPCREDEKDSFRWCGATAKRRPKQVSCRIFFAKLAQMMDWNPDYRYKLLGKLIRANQELLFVFDLTSTEVYQSITVLGDGKTHRSRKPTYPAEWQNQFGLPVAEHRKQLQIDIFKDFTIFRINDEQAPHTGTVESEVRQS